MDEISKDKKAQAEAERLSAQLRAGKQDEPRPDYDPKQVAKEVYVKYIDLRVWSGHFDQFWEKCSKDMNRQSRQGGRRGAVVGVMSRDEYVNAVRGAVYGLNAMNYMREAEKAKRNGDAVWRTATLSFEERLKMRDEDVVWVEIDSGLLRLDTEGGSGLEGQAMVNDGSDSVMKMMVSRILDDEE